METEGKPLFSLPITAPPPQSLLMPDLEKNLSKDVPIFYKGIDLKGLNRKSKEYFHPCWRGPRLVSPGKIIRDSQAILSVLYLPMLSGIVPHFLKVIFFFFSSLSVLLFKKDLKLIHTEVEIIATVCYLSQEYLHFSSDKNLKGVPKLNFL